MDYDRAAEPLIAALGDTDATVRTAAAEALGRLKATAAFDRLVKLLADPDINVGTAAVEALGRLGDSRAVEPLAKLTGKDDLQFQMAVAVGLMRLNDSRGLEGITKCLQNPDSKTREDATIALLNSWYRSESLVDPLIVLLNDSNVSVRVLAMEILASIGSRPAIDAILAKTADREVLSDDLRTSMIKTKDDRWLEMLVHQLDDDDSKIRTFAAAAIGRFGSETRRDGTGQALERPLAGSPRRHRRCFDDARFEGITRRTPNRLGRSRIGRPHPRRAGGYENRTVNRCLFRATINLRPPCSHPHSSPPLPPTGPDR